MENPRLRLLFLAWLRGYIKSDYPHGLRSRIREELVMRAVMRDTEAGELSDIVRLKQAAIPLLAPLARQGAFSATHRILQKMHALRRLMPLHRVKDIGSAESSLREIKQMGAALNVLQHTDLYARLKAIADRET